MLSDMDLALRKKKIQTSVFDQSFRVVHNNVSATLKFTVFKYRKVPFSSIHALVIFPSSFIFNYFCRVF